MQVRQKYRALPTWARWLAVVVGVVLAWWLVTLIFNSRLTVATARAATVERHVRKDGTRVTVKTTRINLRDGVPSWVELAPATVQNPVKARMAQAGIQCPYWIYPTYIDPETGENTGGLAYGTVPYDLCVEQPITAIVARATRRNDGCDIVSNKIKIRNRIAPILWVKLTDKRWCWRDGRITSVANPRTESGTTLWGRMNLWHNAGLQSRQDYYDGAAHWWHHTAATWEFYTAIPLPVVGDVHVHEIHPTNWIRVYGNGSFGKAG